MWKSTPKIVLAGAPASGKSILCQKIREEYGCVHLCTGDMLRASIQENSELGKTAKLYMTRGELLPDDIMIDIILQRLKEEDCATKGWLLDGYPRTPEQGLAIINAGIIADKFIVLDVADEILYDRFSGRRLDPVTGNIYHLLLAPPESTEIADRLIQRADDVEEKVKIRIEAYHENLASILGIYSDKLLRIDGNMDFLWVWDDVRYKLSRLYKHNIIFALGSPDSEITTLAQMVANKHDYEYINMNTLVKAERNVTGTNGDMPVELDTYVSSSSMLSVLETALSISAKKFYIIEGFPRNTENLIAFYSTLSNKCNVDLAIYLNSTKVDSSISQAYTDDISPVLIKFETSGKLRRVSSLYGFDTVLFETSQILHGVNLINPYTRTLAILKPDIVCAGKIPEVLSTVYGIGLSVVQSMFVNMNLEVVNSFYSYQLTSAGYPEVVKFLCSGPSLVLVLEGIDAVKKWRSKAESLQKSMGIDSIRNAVHGSEYDCQAFGEINFWFEKQSIGYKCAIEHPALTMTSVSMITGKIIRALKTESTKFSYKAEDTVAIIKPIVSFVNYTDIMAVIRAQGFEVVSELKTTLTHHTLSLLDLIPRHIDYSLAVAYLTSAPVVILHLRRVGAIKGMTHLIGPEESFKFKSMRRDSLRALYASSDGIQDVIYSPGTYELASKMLTLFFPLYKQNNPIDTPNDLEISKEPEPTLLPIKSKNKHNPHPRPLVSAVEKQTMLTYLQNDINQQLTGFISRAIISQPEEFIDFAINDFTEQKRTSSVVLTVPTGKSPGNKLEPLVPQSVVSSSQSATTSLSPILPAVVRTETAGIRINQSIELFANLEAAKAEIESLRGAITIISKNIRDQGDASVETFGPLFI